MEKYRFITEQETEIVAIIENCRYTPEETIKSAVKDITKGKVSLTDEDITAISCCNVIEINEHCIAGTLDGTIIISKTNNHWSLKQYE